MPTKVATLQPPQSGDSSASTRPDTVLEVDATSDPRSPPSKASPASEIISRTLMTTDSEMEDQTKGQSGSDADRPAQNADLLEECRARLLPIVLKNVRLRGPQGDKQIATIEESIRSQLTDTHCTAFLEQAREFKRQLAAQRIKQEPQDMDLRSVVPAQRPTDSLPSGSEISGRNQNTSTTATSMNQPDTAVAKKVPTAPRAMRLAQARKRSHSPLRNHRSPSTPRPDYRPHSRHATPPPRRELGRSLSPRPRPSRSRSPEAHRRGRDRSYSPPAAERRRARTPCLPRALSRVYSSESGSGLVYNEPPPLGVAERSNATSRSGSVEPAPSTSSLSTVSKEPPSSTPQEHHEALLPTTAVIATAAATLPQRRPSVPHHSGPGLWFFIRGLTSPGVLEATFSVDSDIAMAAKRWSDKTHLIDSSETHVAVRLLCLSRAVVESALQDMSMHTSAGQILETIIGLPHSWPGDGGLMVTNCDELSRSSGTWLPDHLTLHRPPLDVTSSIISGKNTMSIIQFMDLSAYMFLLYAAPPPPEELDAALRKQELKRFMLQSSSRGIAWSIPVGVTRTRACVV